jgi:hypothetical protein
MARYNSLRHLGSSCLCHALSLDMVLCETLNRRAKSACDAEPSARTLTRRAARCHWKVLSRVGGNRYGARLESLKMRGIRSKMIPIHGRRESIPTYQSGTGGTSGKKGEDLPF